MDFFDAQDHARRLSRGLIVLFLGAVVGMIAIVYLAILVVMGFAPLGPGVGVGVTGPGGSWFTLHPEILLGVTLGMGALIGGGTAFRTSQLSRGGASVAELLGGRRVEPTTQDEGELRLLNVVEEMSIASGLPVPAVFVLEGEAGINAFAAGHTSSDAAVAVTRGALDSLTRDELQGVVAHEFSHILNGDMRLNLRLMGLLFGIFLLSVVGRGILRGGMMGRGRRSGGKGGGGQVALVGVVLIVLGYLGVVFGRLIQAAVSRQREFLADAAAVEFTRNPAGLARALRRIGAGGGSRIQNHHAQEAGHLFFAGGTGKALLRLTSTHPPLEERIRRLDPKWDGDFTLPAGETPGPALGGAPPPSRDLPEGRGGAAAGALLGFPAALVASAGAPQARHVDHARRLLAQVPTPLREAVRTPEGAVATLLALLQGSASAPDAGGAAGEGVAAGEGDASGAGATAPAGAPWPTGSGDALPTPRAPASRYALVADALGAETARRAAELEGPVQQLGAAARLPLLELALPALRTLPRDRANALRSTVRTLMGESDVLGTFDFALFHMLQRTLAAGAGGARPRRPGSVPLSRLRGEAEILLSAVAWSSRGDQKGLAVAFDAGAAHLADGNGDHGYRLRSREGVTLDQVDAALERMEQGSPSARKVLLEAAAATVQADGVVEVEETEMLRALAEALEVPLPPHLPGPHSPTPGASRR